MMSNEELLKEIRTLPIEDQLQVIDFIHFLLDKEKSKKVELDDDLNPSSVLKNSDSLTGQGNLEK